MTQPTPKTYEEALAAAATIQAARAAGPDPAALVSQLSEQVASVRDKAAAWAKNRIRGLWAPVNPYNVAQVDEFAASAAKIMGTAQTTTARAAAAAQVRQLAAVGIKVTAIPSNPLDVRAPGARIAAGTVQLQRHAVTVDYTQGESRRVTPAEMTTEAVFRRPAVTFRYVESDGGDDPAQRASLRIDTLVEDNLMLAQRLAEHDVIAKAVDLDQPGAKIIGIRRVIHPELSRTGTCGLCIAAADRIYSVRKLRAVHNRCWCTTAVVTEQHDPGDDVNQADLSQLYTDAGGTSAAHLKRTRYKVDEHGELGPVLVPKKAYKPRGASPAAPAPAARQESAGDVARRHLPILEKNLATILAAGASEDSPQVQYHRQQIARFTADLAQ